MKRETSRPPSSANCKKLKDKSLSAPKRDFQPLSFLREGCTLQATSLASIGRSRMIRDPIYEHCGRNNRGKCWNQKGACYASGSLDHQTKDCPSKVDTISKQSMHGTKVLKKRRDPKQLKIGISLRIFKEELHQAQLRAIYQGLCNEG